MNLILHKYLYPWLDAIALLAWGSLLLKYALTGQLKLLIHPNYFGLVLASSILLLILGIIAAILILINRKKKTEINQHITLFPPGFSSSLLLIVAIAGLIIPPKVLTSQTAMQRENGDIPLTNSQPQAFRTTTKPESRSLIDWIRTINAYPEPDAYQGQAAKISGFVLYKNELPDNYLVLSRFVITCCAIDAYPIGLPVKLETSRNNYPLDTWLEIKGKMITETFSETTETKRSLVLAAESLTQIPTPSDPYNYK